MLLLLVWLLFWVCFCLICCLCCYVVKQAKGIKGDGAENVEQLPGKVKGGSCVSKCENDCLFCVLEICKYGCL